MAKLPAVKPFAAWKGAVLLGTLAAAARAQAPASADLWRLSAASLAGPAALETGPTGAFWNPAAAWGDPQVRAGVQVLETPDALSVSGLLAGLSYRLSPALAAQVLLGRTDVGDLVRTTTSPTSDLGAIPVYEQLIGLGVALRRGGASAGALLRAHNARFDAARDNGLTLDLGVRARLGRCSIAAATHFFPLDITSRNVTDFYAGGECQPVSPRVWGTPGRVFVRYGVSARRGGPVEQGMVEHAFGSGLELNQHFRLDAAMVREQGYAEVDWRPVLAVQLRVGRYAIAAARSSGLGGLGASYRIGLDVDVLR